MKVLVINCGSSSLKYQLIDMSTEESLAQGLVERIGIEGSVLTQKVEGRDKYIIKQPMADHKDAIKLVLEAYFALISLHCLKYSEKVKEDDTQGKKDIEKMYELQYIKGYTEFFIADTEKAILAQKKREKVSEGFVDFDDFFEQVYHISLAKDSTARINLENYSINKIREASRAG